MIRSSANGLDSGQQINAFRIYYLNKLAKHRRLDMNMLRRTDNPKDC